MNVPRETLAYIAGFFDGEGCVGIKKATKAAHTPYATIGQTRPEVLRQIQCHFGGSIRHTGFVWIYWLSCRKAVNFLKAIEPFTVVKKQEINLLLQAFAVLTFNKKSGVPQELKDLRERNRQLIVAARKQNLGLNQWPLQ